MTNIINKQISSISKIYFLNIQIMNHTHTHHVKICEIVNILFIINHLILCINIFYMLSLKTIKNYESYELIIENNEYSLYKSQLIDNPLSKQLLYTVRKNTIKGSDQIFFSFIKQIKENAKGIYPSVIQLVQSESSYYIVFTFADDLEHACCVQKKYIEDSLENLTNRKLLLHDLKKIAEFSDFQIKEHEILVMNNNKLVVLPYFNKPKGDYHEHNKKFVFELAYMLFFGEKVNSDTRKEKQNFFKLLEENYKNSDLGDTINKFIEKSKLPPGPLEFKMEKSSIKNTNSTLVKLQEQQLDDIMINMGVNTTLKKLAFDIRNTRNSYNPTKNVEDPKKMDIDIKQLGIKIQKQQKTSPSPQNYPNKNLPNPISKIFTPQKNEKIVEAPKLPVHYPPNPKKDNIKKVEKNQQFNKNQKILTFDQIQKIPQSPQLSNTLNNPNLPNTQINKLKQTQKDTKIQIELPQTPKVVHNDDTCNILKSVKTSFMVVSGGKSIMQLEKPIPKKVKKEQKIYKQRTPVQQFQYQLASYLTQFEVMYKLIESFLGYYKTSNMGIVAAYLIARSIVIRKLKLIATLTQRKDIFQVGKSTMKSLNIQKYTQKIKKDLFRQDPTQFIAIINFKTIPAETYQILEPYLGEINIIDRTEELCFYYLYTLGQRDPVRDLHHLMLADVLFLLLHNNFQFVYDWKSMPTQWDEEYVQEKSKTIQILMFKLK